MSWKNYEIANKKILSGIIISKTQPGHSDVLCTDEI